MFKHIFAIWMNVNHPPENNQNLTNINTFAHVEDDFKGRPLKIRYLTNSRKQASEVTAILNHIPSKSNQNTVKQVHI